MFVIGIGVACHFIDYFVAAGQPFQYGRHALPVFLRKVEYAVQL